MLATIVLRFVVHTAGMALLLVSTACPPCDGIPCVGRFRLELRVVERSRRRTPIGSP